MQNMILPLFALFFTAGLYLISAELLSVPTYKATKAILSIGKRERKKALWRGCKMGKRDRLIYGIKCSESKGDRASWTTS